MITPAQKQRHDIGRVRRGSMANLSKPKEYIFGALAKLLPKARSKAEEIAKRFGLLPDAIPIVPNSNVQLDIGALPKQTSGFNVFHGSPHNFPPVRELEMPDGTRLIQDLNESVDLPDGAIVLEEYPMGKFDISKIGTGEGAQVYGRGFYFGEAEGTGKTYRDQLSGGSTASARRTLEATDGDVDRAIEETQEKLYRLQERNDTGAFDNDQRMFNMQRQIQQDKLDQLREYKDSGRFNSGSLYEVKIDADPNDFLNYDLPVDKQPKKLAEAIKAISETQSIPVLNQFGESTSFGSFLDALTDKIGAKNATQEFTDAGIVGTKYLDQNSRSVGKGTRNYVVFDNKLISIVKKYGIVGASTILGVSILDVEQAMAQGLEN